VTLASTGLDGFETPVGVFTIRRKLISDTMANLGPEAGDDRYRVEDVPWTQYFEGSVALHAAFWHGQFGMRRSHGCVNLAPQDARRIFSETWPRIPEGWHGASTDRTGFPASRVVVTQ
jgi:lipoprotein-anchoring transpeptidase ErfK/SrfK